ncbi:MAG TPA: cardiolipin synthase ClsB [Methylotenera sp.]|nr:cardiolipin synthase ClsB [Methylotenera sp.]
MTHFLGGNQIQLLRNGAEYFPALEAAIENAVNEIYLQTYIYQADKIGVRIGNALKRSAQRGVMVNLLLDGFGCKNLPKTYVKELELAGVQVMFYRPKISPWTFKKNRLRRLHRKVVVIDGKIGFVGGINIIDDYNVPTHMPPRIDYAVRIEGNLLPAMLASVHKLWRRIALVHLEPVRAQPINSQPSFLKAINTDNPSTDAAATQPTKGLKAAFIMRDNILHRHDIEKAYLTAIGRAHNEVIIANAYFVPGRKFRKALLEAAKRGVTVKLLLQGRMEYFLMFATHAFYSVFLRHGVEIYEYRKGFMHSKVAVIDSHWATIGSSNIDPFSLLLAREANVVVQDKIFAETLRTDIMLAIQDGTYQVSPQEWANGHLIKRLVSWLAYGLVRGFVGVIGYSKEQ